MNLYDVSEAVFAFSSCAAVLVAYSAFYLLPALQELIEQQRFQAQREAEVLRKARAEIEA